MKTGRHHGLRRRLRSRRQPTATTTLSGCATDSTKFYNTTTGDQLKQAFRDIALKINQLYLTH